MPAIDPYWGYVTFGMSLAGKSGTQVTHDVTGKLVSAKGNAQITGDQGRFGAGSMVFDGSGDCLYSPHSDALLLGGSDFTIEAWVFVVSMPSGSAGIVGKQASAVAYGEFVFAVSSSGNLVFGSTSAAGGSSWTLVSLTGTSPLTASQWTHVAITRAGSLFTLWKNGVSVATASASGGIGAGSGGLSVGANKDDGQFSLNGYVNDVRVTRGIARYTTSFSVPDAPFYWPSLAEMFSTPGPDTRTISAFSMPRASSIKNSAISGWSDIYFGGDGMIVDTVSKKSGSSTVPVVRRVRLHEQLSGIVVAETWSGTDGRYAFANLSRAYSYYAVAFDHTGEYPAGVIAENLVPERMQ